MSNTKYTKGPWEFAEFPKAKDWDVASDTTPVCSGYLNDEGKANARLIAAAPELLEALEMVAQHAPASGPLWHGSEPMTKARAAIAKAKGES